MNALPGPVRRWLAPEHRVRKPGRAHMSALGGCKRRVFHELRGDEPCNDPEPLPFRLGTAIHAALDEGDGEQHVEIFGLDLGGRIDLVEDGKVIDYKTTLLATIKFVKRNGPPRYYRWQVQTYAHAWNLAHPDDPVHTVELVYIPRDGKRKDIWTWSEPFLPEVAEEALEWLAEVRQAVAAGVAPEPEMVPSFCKDYCPFWGLYCTGLLKEPEEERFDPWAEAAAEDYLKGLEMERAAKELKAGARLALEGYTGRTGDFEVHWSDNGHGGAYPVVRRIA